MKYGRLHEQDAIQYLKENMNIDVKPCGLFVNPEFAYL